MNAETLSKIAREILLSADVHPSDLATASDDVLVADLFSLASVTDDATARIAEAVAEALADTI